MFKNYTFRQFEVTEKSTGINGQAQFCDDVGIYEINIKMDDGRKLITHQNAIAADFDFMQFEFVDAKAEKVLVDGGRIK